MEMRDISLHCEAEKGERRGRCEDGWRNLGASNSRICGCVRKSEDSIVTAKGRREGGQEEVDWKDNMWRNRIATKASGYERTMLRCKGRTRKRVLAGAGDGAELVW